VNFTTSPFLYRLNFLIKHKANIKIILAFLKFQFLKFFYNHFRSKEKKKKKYINKNKKKKKKEK